MPRLTLSKLASAHLRTQDAAEEARRGDEGWLIPYAERLARKRWKKKPLPMYHLAPAARLFERAFAGEEVRGVIGFPVRHGKSTLAQAAILGGLRRDPSMRINYASYAADLAEAKMYEVRQLCAEEGISLDPSFQTDAEWRTSHGGAVKAGGLIGGPWNGQGAHLNLLDDPYKGPEQAMSRGYREKTREAFDGAWMTRLEPGGSAIVLSARWCPPDLSGELEAEGWEVLNIPCLSSDDRPLWPERWTVEQLHKIKATNPWWHALYQSSPRPEGQRVFDPAHLVTYSSLPDGAYVEVMGVDVAYGAKDRHDRSALVVWRRYLPSLAQREMAPVHAAREARSLYLVEAWVGHEPVELFACRVAEVQYRRGGAGPRLRLPRTADEIERVWRPQLATLAGARQIPAMWYGSTTEAGTAGLMAGYGARVRYERAAVDKLARAQAGGYTAAWAEGRVRWPARGDAHTDRLRVQHEDFTGASGDSDDGVDAAVAGHDFAGIPPPRSLGGRARELGSWGFTSREG